MYYAAGSRDVGVGRPIPSTYFLLCGLAHAPCSLGSPRGFSDHAAKRLVSHFGPLNRVIQITTKFRLVIVDAPSLVDEDEEWRKHGVPINICPSVGGPVELIKGLSKPPGEQTSGDGVMTADG